MKNSEQQQENTNIDELTPEQARRQFMKKYGKLAAITPLAVTALMTPKTSAAPSSTACSRPNPPAACSNPKPKGFG
ncbi:hypothetical protein [Thalassotalea litorea]|uniref:hypothetical protein n=1 Tax=Thalassotalea litorea TaxID=2020715 RepID=UPI0037350751